MFVVIGILIGLAAGAALAFFVLYALAGSRLAAARRTRQLLLAEARREAEAMGREAQIEAREESVKLRSEVEREIGARRAEIIKIEEPKASWPCRCVVRQAPLECWRLLRHQ